MLSAAASPAPRSRASPAAASSSGTGAPTCAALACSLLTRSIGNQAKNRPLANQNRTCSAISSASHLWTFAQNPVPAISLPPARRYDAAR